MNEFENDAIKDDRRVEITDLDPFERTPRFSRIFIALERRPSLRKRFWRIATASGTFLLILLVLFSTFPFVRGLASGFYSRLISTHSTTPVTTTTTPVGSNAFNAKEVIVLTSGNSSPIIPSSTLGPAPQDCPVISQTQGFDFRGAPRTAGSSPVLVIGFGGPDAVLTHLHHAQPPEIGWFKRIVLLTETNYAGTVAFRGGELRDGTPIWFGMKQHNQGPITSFTVLPLNSNVSNHTGSDEEWGILTTTLYFPGAGCYFLLAMWPEGEWVVFFSAGQ